MSRAGKLGPLSGGLYPAGGTALRMGTFREAWFFPQRDPKPITLELGAQDTFPLMLSHVLFIERHPEGNLRAPSERILTEEAKLHARIPDSGGCFCHLGHGDRRGRERPPCLVGRLLSCLMRARRCPQQIFSMRSSLHYRICF